MSGENVIAGPDIRLQGIVIHPDDNGGRIHFGTSSIKSIDGGKLPTAPPSPVSHQVPDDQVGIPEPTCSAFSCLIGTVSSVATAKLPAPLEESSTGWDGKDETLDAQAEYGRDLCQPPIGRIASTMSHRLTDWWLTPILDASSRVVRPCSRISRRKFSAKMALRTLSSFLAALGACLRADLFQFSKMNFGSSCCSVEIAEFVGF